jgi:hypothetical protein
VKANAKVFLSGRKLRWGRKADERNKTIPTNRILCMIWNSSRERKKFGVVPMRLKFFIKWHKSLGFVKLKISGVS